MEMQDFLSEQQEIYMHQLHQKCIENIRDHLRNTPEESFNAHWTNDNRNKMKNVPQEILKIKDHYKIFKRTDPSWKSVLFPVSTREMPFNNSSTT